MLVLLVQPAFASLDILIIGSTHSYSEGGETGVVHEKPFNPSGIATQLQSILAQDPAISETVNVVFEDAYKNKVLTTAITDTQFWSRNFHSYSLAQYFMWPDGKDTRMSNLRGQNGTAWDYIIVCEDPYVMANFPGMYAEGIKMIQSEVSKGTAQLVLLGQWPENSSGFTATQFNEIVHRVADSGSLAAVPAGKAWSSFSAQDTNAAHPTPKGQYLAAASIYSKLFNRNASTSGYTYDDTIADHAMSVVQATNGVAQYSGTYTSPNPFQMKYTQKRHLTYSERGTSTEDGIINGLNDAFGVLKMTSSQFSVVKPVDFHFSRGSDIFEPDKQYLVNPALFARSYGFPMQDDGNTGGVTMLYGIDKRQDNGTDLGVAYSMIREGEVAPTYDVRCIPMRLMWSKMDHEAGALVFPYRNPTTDLWHISDELERAMGAFLITLNTGRCPIEDEPVDNTSTAWQRWYGKKIGYETAWQLSHLTTRVPGFRVVPSDSSALLGVGATQTLAVQFRYPPTSDVTVSLSVDDPSSGAVDQSSLTFTPANHETVQYVTVSVPPVGPSGTHPFNVTLTTSSSDPVFDGLSDQWNFEGEREFIKLVGAPSVISEDGSQAFTVALSRPPATDVVLNLSSSDTAEATISPSSLTFSSSNWNVPRTVTVSGVEDAVTGAGAATLTISVNDALSDDSFDNEADVTIGIDILDNDGGFYVLYLGNTSQSGSPPIDSSSPYANGAAVTVLGNKGGMVKSGHRFIGWNTAADGSGTAYLPAQTFTITGHTKLYAQWSSSPEGGPIYVEPGNPLIPAGSGYGVGDSFQLVFATSTTINMSSLQKIFGSPRTIDAFNSYVSAIAGGSSRPGVANLTWRVIGSTSSVNARDNAVVSAPVHRLHDGAKVADDSDDLWDGSLDNRITSDENGNNMSSAGSWQIWTGTTVDGNTYTGFGLDETSTRYAAGWGTNNPTDGVADDDWIDLNQIDTGDTRKYRFYALSAPITIAALRTVTYDGNTADLGSAPTDSASPYLDGTSVTVLGNTGQLIKSGYDFAGWNTAANGSGDAYSPGNAFSIAANTTLYAQWVVNTTPRTITYLANTADSGDVPTDPNSPYVNGSTVTVLGNTGSLAKADRLFGGWNTAADGSGASYNGGDTLGITADLTLYAQWVTIPTYTVTYNGNTAGSGAPPTDAASPYQQGTSVTVLGNTGSLTKVGYTFAGWNTSPDGNGEAYLANDSFIITGDTTLYAQWSGANYIVTFNANGGGTPTQSSKPVTFGNAYGSLATTTRSGFTFVGWFTQAVGGTQVTDVTTVTTAADHTLHAHWVEAIGIEVLPDSPLIPSGHGYGVGDTFHLVFVTSISTRIDLWSAPGRLTNANSYVNSIADSSSIAGIPAINWYAIASDTNKDAKDNALIIGPVHNLGGELVAANSGDMWDGDLGPNNDTANPFVGLIRYDESGNLLSYNSSWQVWTGTLANGVASNAGLDHSSVVYASAYGKQNDPNDTGGSGYANNWINLTTIAPASTRIYRFYALSEPITIVAAADTTAPTLASTDIVDDQSGADVDIDTLVTYTVTFSEDMDAATVSAADFSNAGTAAASIGTVTETSPGVFSVPVTVTGAGSLQLKVPASAVLKDAAGNAMDTTSAIVDDTTLTVLTAYESWTGGGAGTSFSADANGDGIADGLAWVLGTATVGANAHSNLPVGNAQGNGDLILQFSMRPGVATVILEYSNDLGVADPWANHQIAVPGSSSTIENIVFVITANGDLVDVRATIPAAAAGAGKLFGRISVAP